MGINHFLSHSLPTSRSCISVAEFVPALHSVLSPPSTTGCDHVRKIIGLAISGGVDSMALASLCSQVQGLSRMASSAYSCKDLSEYRFHAFIVDHGVRKGSDEEAAAVSQVLRRREIESEVLKINWQQQNPEMLPNFESVARTNRFRALGKACKDFGIISLLLAHHQDDQVETLFMRMIAGHRTTGLVGIQPAANIPECYGIHGVHESGGLDEPERRIGEPEMPILGIPHRPPMGDNIPIEFGGIRVCRPLLGFSKSRLRATCVENGMEWFEDQTNKDPTLTTRNAVRHVFRKHALPAALTQASLLALNQRVKDRAASKSAVIRPYLLQCSISVFDTRVGMIRMKFVNLLSEKTCLSGSHRRQQIATALLRRFITLVAPTEHVNLSSLHLAVQRVFPECFLHHPRNEITPRNFTVSGVLFTLIPTKPPVNSSSISPRTNYSAEKCGWIISRQPYAINSVQPPEIVISPKTALSRSAWSTWQLFDGRFWIRIKNYTQCALYIRPLGKAHLQLFKSRLSKSSKSKLLKLFHELAPGDIRWTLPAVLVCKFGAKDEVICLPTLGIGTEGYSERVEWEVRYKSVNLSDMPL